MASYFADHYAVLHVPPTATQREAIREASPAATPHTGRSAQDKTPDRPQDIPVRRIRHEDPPLRATPVLW
jgi:hypothetical protein